MSELTLQEAKDGLQAIGMWMETRHNYRFVGTPIQTWKIPEKEKGFFTVYAMNLVMESDGFESFVEQKPEDIEAFIHLLRQLGAINTSAFVRDTVSALKKKASYDDYECTKKYYELFEKDEVWLKLFPYLGKRIYLSYLYRAQRINASGKNIFNPKEWEGNLSYKQWWEFWK